MSNTNYKGLLLYNDLNHGDEDSETHTASTATLMSEKQQQPIQNTFAMAKPNNFCPLKRPAITQVKPFKQQLQSHNHNNIPGMINNITANRKTFNENNLSAVRRIRKPSLWMGNVKYAKQQQQQFLNNKSNNNEVMNLDNEMSMNIGNNEIVGELTQRQIRYKSLLAKIKSFIIEFLLDSSIHGFEYLAKIGLTFIER